MGFCPPDDAILKADLTRSPDAHVTLEMWVVDPRTTINLPCRSATEWEECVEEIGRALPPRQLTPAELSEMQRLFESVTIERVLWFPMCIDPCLIDVARWDDRKLHDHKSCMGIGGGAYEVLSYEQMGEIVGFLESLRAASEQ
jgi:hypothetical protein